MHCMSTSWPRIPPTIAATGASSAKRSPKKRLIMFHMIQSNERTKHLIWYLGGGHHKLGQC